MSNSRFIVAVHVLSLLGHEDGPMTSDYIAGSVNTNPVVIRRVLGQLAKFGLVASTEGAGGGTQLARVASKITLAEVYRAVEGDTELFGLPRTDPNPDCLVGRSVQAALRKRTESFKDAMLQKMKTVTVADVLRDALAER